MRLLNLKVSVALVLLTASLVEAACPFFHQNGGATAKEDESPDDHSTVSHDESSRRLHPSRDSAGHGGVPDGGFTAVMADITALLTDSQDFWPADYGNYGGFFTRLAWHCSGSYRKSDGRGGCDGGRIRFAPEGKWPDNANLDKALQLLQPIKEKYGSKLSWGDLIVLAGTTAIKSMGGPFLGFCGGRIDDADGSASLKLGPSVEQEEIAPCQSLTPSHQGTCNLVEGSPIGPTTVGLIYVNPAGPVTSPGNATAAGLDVRRTFAKMGLNDSETVALIGGGHAIGKSHGACPKPPCGHPANGKNTFTSGFEGAWTLTPTVWTNDYFNNLFNYEWTRVIGPGGEIQWFPAGTTNTTAPIFMLTTDIALMTDETYRPLSQLYAQNRAKLENDFAHAWYRLVSNDMGPATRCLGELVPPPEPFQRTLPAAPDQLPDYVPIRKMIQDLLDADSKNYNHFVNLAYRCAFTFRATDYHGGCNGARIRFSPEKDFVGNEGTADALAVLEAVKQAHPEASYADIIVLAGQTAIESASKHVVMPFCGGRVDATDGQGSKGLEPRFYTPAVVSIQDDCQVKGLTVEQCVALAGRPTTSHFSNQFFNDLVAGKGDFTDEQLALLKGDFKHVTHHFASDESAFFEAFQSAWTYMMTADRFAGSLHNACTGRSDPTLPPTTSKEGSKTHKHHPVTFFATMARFFSATQLVTMLPSFFARA